MKKIITLLAFIMSVIQVTAQEAGKNSREQLKPLSYLIGHWKGTATMQQQGKAPIKVSQEEKITWQLDSMLIQVEGIGKDINTGVKNFHAYGLVFYNPATQQLAMKSFTLDGRQAEAYFKIHTENQFEWGFDIPNNRGKIKYTILISEKDKTWNEKGEFSPDGTQWYPFMSMDLAKL